MALADLHELTAMLRMQLPILFSFAVLRWCAGAWAMFWVHLLTPKSLRTQLDTLYNTAVQVHRYAVVAATLLSLVCFAQMPPTDVCGEYVSVRAQGMSCAVALMVLITSNRMFPMAMALATLKAVADTSASTLVLAPSTAVATLDIDFRGATGWLIGLGTVCVGYAVECYAIDQTGERAGGPILAIVLSMLIGLFHVTAALWRRGIGAVRYGLVYRRPHPDYDEDSDDDDMVDASSELGDSPVAADVQADATRSTRTYRKDGNTLTWRPRLETN